MKCIRSRNFSLWPGRLVVDDGDCHVSVPVGEILGRARFHSVFLLLSGAREQIVRLLIFAPFHLVHFFHSLRNVTRSVEVVLGVGRRATRVEERVEEKRAILRQVRKVIHQIQRRFLVKN